MQRTFQAIDKRIGWSRGMHLELSVCGRKHIRFALTEINVEHMALGTYRDFAMLGRLATQWSQQTRNRVLKELAEE